MKALVLVAPLLGLAIASVSQDTPPAQGQKPAPTVEVSVPEVRATSAAAISTRRLSYCFEFEIVRVIDDAAGTAGVMVREGKLDFRCYQGSDEQADKDAAERLIELLDAKPRERDPTNVVERPYELGDSGVLRLTILGRAPPLQDLWILERSDGRRTTIAVGR
jgi:hypothetical protein